MHDSYLLLTPLLMLGVLALVRFVGCDLVLGVRDFPPPVPPFVTSVALGQPRADFDGWVGMSITVGSRGLSVTSLARIRAPGNVSTHIVKIVDATTGVDLPSAVVVVDTIGKVDGDFVYANFANPVHLNAGGTYYVISQEVSAQDIFYDKDTSVVTTADASVTSGVYRDTGAYTTLGSADQTYGPVNFQYTVD